MYKIKATVDMSDFTPNMNNIVKKIPTILELIRKKIAWKVERESKLQLYAGHGKISGQLRRSIRSHFSKNKAIVKPHKIYANWVHDGGLHPRWRTPTKFRGYKYMTIGAKIAEQYAQQIADETANEVLEAL